MLFGMFKNRYDAAHQLLPYLLPYKDNPDVVIVAIPRGALAIGAVLAKELNAPLDVAFVKKISAPGNPEFAIGALSMETFTIDPRFTHLTEHIAQEINLKRKLLQQRLNTYYSGTLRPIDLHNKIVILTDDGIATGQTFLEAIKLIKTQSPKKIIAAIPVSTPDTLEKIKPFVDQIICPLQPTNLYAIGQFYQNFDQVDDTQAIKLLHESRKNL
jgi:putative phosphoribosyl transferase